MRPPMGSIRSSPRINPPTGIDILWADRPHPDGHRPLAGDSALGTTFTYNLVITLSLALASFFAFLAIRRSGTRRGRRSGGRIVVRVLAVHHRPVLRSHQPGDSAATPPLALMLVDEIPVRQRRRPLGARHPHRSACSPAVLHLAGVPAHRDRRDCGGDHFWPCRTATWFARTCRSSFGRLVSRPDRRCRARLSGMASVLRLGPRRDQGAVHGTDMYVTDRRTSSFPRCAMI